MSIVWSGLAPHPPIIVESVGGTRCDEVRPTIDSMQAWARDLLNCKPELVVLISPHTPRPHHGIAWFSHNSGSFNMFGAGHCRIELPSQQDWLAQLFEKLPHGQRLDNEPLDHGAMVPLHFLLEAGWQGATCVLGLPRGEGPILEQLGDTVAQLCDNPKRCALIASGDMSHCLKPDAPSGFNPIGQDFDNRFVELVRAGDFRAAANIELQLQQQACQDVVASCRLVWQATGYNANNNHFYSYEGPFGVGYTVMRFHGDTP